MTPAPETDQAGAAWDPIDDLAHAARESINNYGDLSTSQFEELAERIVQRVRDEARAAEKEACATLAEKAMAGYLCPFARDKPGDPTWNLTDKDKCPVCGYDGEDALFGCHDNASGRIAAAIRARTEDGK